MNREVRYGIVGYGWLARDYADPALRGLHGARLVAACDRSSEARALARERGLAAFDDLDAMLACVDAVYVATPNDAHRSVVERAAARGKHVLCEKPMAIREDDGAAMLDACARANVTYATAYDQRFHPAHVRARDVVRAGDLGTVTAVRIVYACWVARDFADDNWRIDPSRSGGGALVDLAPHGLDLIATTLGDEIVEARAFAQRAVHDYGVDDGAMIVARTRGDVLAQLHVAYNHPETLPRRRLEIVGTAGLLHAENTMGQTPGGTLDLIRASDGTTRRVSFDRDASPFAGLVRSFTDEIMAGRGFDAAVAARERASLATLASLMRDADRGTLACR